MPDARQQFVLVRASKNRPEGKWADDDYDVLNASGRVVGRIFRPPQAPDGQPWFWSLLRTPQRATDRGYATTRERAMLEFRAAWDPMPTDDAEALLAWGRRNVQGE